MNIYIYILVQIFFFQKKKKNVVIINSIFSSYTSINQSIDISFCKPYFIYILSKMNRKARNTLLYLYLIQDKGRKKRCYRKNRSI